MEPISRWLVCLGALIAPAIVAGCSRTSVAQEADDPVAPVRCYQLADDRLLSASALQLCASATSDMPARCFAEADERIGRPDAESVELCYRAISLGPVQCFERLDETTTLEATQIIDYCRAPACDFSPPPAGGAPECLEAADLADIQDETALQLCAGSTSSAPVACYIAGDDLTLLTAYELAQLCTRVPLCY